MNHLITSGLILSLLAGSVAPADAARRGKAERRQATASATPPLPKPNPRREPVGSGISDAVAAEATDTAAPLTPEAEQFRVRDAALASIGEAGLSLEDKKRLASALKAVAVGKITTARTLEARLTDPVARKIVEWFALRNGFGQADDFVAFSEANPAWPDRDLLRKRAEEQLFVAGGSSQEIRAFFAGREPATGAGYAALASAYLAEKDEAKARSLAAIAWRDYELASTLEAGFIDRFKHLLTEADHRARLDRILVDSVRFSSTRKRRAEIAKRVVPLLSKDERKKAIARIAVFLGLKTAGKLLASLPTDRGGKTDWALEFQRLQYLRARGRIEEVWKILERAPADAENLVSPDDWWTERRSAAYAALRQDKAETAYAIVRDPGPLSVNPRKDAAFLAGWLALRYLDDADKAIGHFQRSRDAADGPLTLARAEYWLGRALEKAGRNEEARTHYSAAAELFDTFHGQLARQKIGSGTHRFVSTLPALPSADETARFTTLDAVRAVVIAEKAGVNDSIVRALLGHLRYYLNTEAELALLAHLAERLGDTQMAVRIGKTAIARGMNLVSYAYPTKALPAYKALRAPPERAVLLGIARQESEFNPSVVSSAGARGLLQVMPMTARHICRRHKIKCDIPRLLSDPGYNAMIASAYVGDRMAEFSGNYVLTLAGYNAGPGRAREWIRKLGDPRDPDVDPIDWIEGIPFEETREYVKKVLSNIQVYRARLGEEQPLRLAEDLKPPRADGNSGG